MTPKSPEFKAALSAVRKDIATAKRRGTRSGFIDYSGCISVTNDFMDIIVDAKKATSRREYAFAYSVAGLVQINLAKLASSADDSSGCITDTRFYVKELLEIVCSGVERGSDEAEYILLQSIKDSQNEAFNGWIEFAYDILLKTARLAVEENENQMLTALDELYGKAKQDVWSNWVDEFDALGRLEIIKATGSEVDAIDYVNENLKYDKIRRVAVEMALAVRQVHENSRR